MPIIKNTLYAGSVGAISFFKFDDSAALNTFRKWLWKY